MKKGIKTFTTDPAIIFDLIQRQSGSLHKALLELISNSVDAGAKQIDVLVPDDGKTCAVIDDGAGFASEAEIEKYFGTFGFDHSTDAKQASRQFGRFGLGRGQAMSFGRVKYTTNQFITDTDIKNRGLDYEVVESPEVLHEGCRVDIEFYNPLSPYDVRQTVRELSEWARFMDTSISVNGKRVTEGVDSVEWSLEDDDAYYLFDSSNSIRVYNRGVYVTSLHAYEFGTGGLVVTKSRLELDMSRTQLLHTACDVWKRIRSKIKKLHRKASLQSKGLTMKQRAAVIGALRDGEVTWKEVYSKPIFVDVRGRGISPEDLRHQVRCFGAVSIAPSDEKVLAEQLHQSSAFILGSAMTDLFDLWGGGVSALEKLQQDVEQWRVRAGYEGNGLDPFADATFVPFAELAKDYKGDQRLLADKDMQRPAWRVLDAARRWMNQVVMRGVRRGGGDLNSRRLVGGVSLRAIAWTDGSDYIALTEDLLIRASKSEAGARELVRTLVHEYCHDEASGDQHSHGVEFFERFHDVMFHMTAMETEAVLAFCREYAARSKTKAAKGRVPKWMLTHLSVKVRDTLEADAEALLEGDEPVSDLTWLREELQRDYGHLPSPDEIVAREAERAQPKAALGGGAVPPQGDAAEGQLTLL